MYHWSITPVHHQVRQNMGNTSKDNPNPNPN